MAWVSRGSLADGDCAPGSGDRSAALVESHRTSVVHITRSNRPDAVVYEQDGDGWLLLLDGPATVALDGVVVVLAAGDRSFLPARVPHRSEASEHGTRWLAVQSARRGATPGAGHRA